MPRPKPPNVVRYTVRLSRAQGERVAALKKQLHASSDNEVFDYLVTIGTNQRDDLEQLVYSLFGNLADSLAHRFQSLETYEQVNLTAAREFQRRRQSDAYNPSQLGIEDEPRYSPTPSDEV
jgi:hypothetical protein